MAFPPAVAQQALVACGRRCCLCHKFTGTKIELHHIEPQAQGGADTFENCIPLCFDCHAEVEHYNPNHPKGRRFTAGELRAHRDQWYQKIATTGSISADERFSEMDRDVVGKIREFIPRKRLDYLRNFDYGAAFDDGWHEDLERFHHEADGPDYEFMDADLEALRANLRAAVGKFLHLKGKHTWPTNTGPGIRSIPDDWKYHEEERWERAREELNEGATAVSDAYDVLLRQARVKLGKIPGDPAENR